MIGTRRGFSLALAVIAVAAISAPRAAEARTSAAPAVLAAATSVAPAAPAAAPGPPAQPESQPGGGRMVEFPAAGETVKAYLTVPALSAARGGAVVVHEWWGLNDQIRSIADRLAKEGYAAIAPDLYRGEVASDPERAHELMRGLQETRASSILRAAAEYLRSTEEAAGRKVAVIGFCMGGRLALVAALGGRDLSSVVMFYGQPVLEKEKLAALSAPVLGLFGGDDHGIPASDVHAFEDAARAAGKSLETHIYPGAGHAFFNETRPSYNAGASADAWKRTLAFLEKALAR